MATDKDIIPRIPVNQMYTGFLYYIHGKDEVIGPIPIGSSKKKYLRQSRRYFFLCALTLFGLIIKSLMCVRSAGQSLRSKKRGIQGKRTKRSGAYENM